MNTSSERRRKVHFMPEKDSLAAIENDYTEDEARNYWFSDTELTKIAVRSLKEALKAFDSDNIRGLEVSTLHGKEIHDAAIRTCVDAVMDEQEVQWENDEEDFDRLAIVSQDVSAASIELALERAKQDELEAQRIYLPMEEDEHPQPTTKVVSKKKFTSHLDDATTICSDLSVGGLDSSRRHSLETFVGSTMEMESLLTLSSSELVDLSENSKEASCDTMISGIEVEQVPIDGSHYDHADNNKGMKSNDTIQASMEVDQEQTIDVPEGESSQSVEHHVQERLTNDETIKHEDQTTAIVVEKTGDTTSAKAENAESTPRGKWRTALRIGGMVVVASSLFLLYNNVESLWGTRDTCLEVASDILLMYPVSLV